MSEVKNQQNIMTFSKKTLVFYCFWPLTSHFWSEFNVNLTWERQLFFWGGGGKFLDQLVIFDTIFHFHYLWDSLQLKADFL